jgi:putative membrane protein
LLDDRPRPTIPYELAWSIHPSVIIGTGLLGAFYFWAIRRGYLRPSPGERVAFGGALLVLLVSLNGPVHDLSDYYLFSVHMAQHLLLTLVFPPLLLVGVGRIWYPASNGRTRGLPLQRGLRVATHPVSAAVVYTATLAVWHVPAMYDLMMRSHEVHIVTHLMFMAAATLMWWPVMSRVSALPGLTPGLGMLYLFLVGLPMQLVAALITIADGVLYPWYAEAPRTWGLSPLDDQRLGGLLMWVPGNIWMFLAIGVLFFRWAREEQQAA